MTRRAALLFGFAAAAALGLLHAPPAEPQTKVARVGVVHVWWPLDDARAVAEFRKRLAELGWGEGRNLTIEERWTEGRNERLPSLMREVLARDVDVLMTYSTPGAVAAKNATTTVPIVVALMGDPVATGLANSLASPGGNVTGLSGGFGQGFCGKWLELAQETVPKSNTVAVLTNPDHPLAGPFRQEIEAIAPTRGLKPKFIEVRAPAALDGAFQQARQSAQAV